MRAGILVFPGSNCDHDCYHVLKHVLGAQAEFVWHKTERLPDVALVVVPGGFSYGDYLRAGAIARFSPIMQAVEKFAAGGGLVLGVCNGFQILVEAGLLPGALMRNSSLKFICAQVSLRVETTRLPYTALYRKDQVISLPIAHAEGSYYVDPANLERMKGQGQIAFRYCSPEGETGPAWNPNGSVESIAGVCNAAGNVLGKMPHPERFSEVLLGGADGLPLFKSVLQFIEEGEAVRGKG